MSHRADLSHVSFHRLGFAESATLSGPGFGLGLRFSRRAAPADAPDDFAGAPPDEKWLLPAKYGNTATSGFTAAVKADAKNDFKFDLPD